MYHIDSTMVRVGKKMEKVFINPDWTHYDVKDKKVRTLPMFPNFQDGRCVLMFKDYESGFQRYGIPDYIAAAESGSIEIDYLIQKYNRAKFENGYMPSAIIEIDGSMSDDEAEELISLALRAEVITKANLPGVFSNNSSIGGFIMIPPMNILYQVSD